MATKSARKPLDRSDVPRENGDEITLLIDFDTTVIVP